LFFISGDIIFYLDGVLGDVSYLFPFVVCLFGSSASSRFLLCPSFANHGNGFLWALLIASLSVHFYLKIKISILINIKIIIFLIIFYYYILFERERFFNILLLNNNCVIILGHPIINFYIFKIKYILIFFHKILD